jgi:DNA (cytosine-5)-methyltransferase 1
LAKTIKYIDLFSGIGGFRRGLQQVNETIENNRTLSRDEEGVSALEEIGTYRCVFSNDFDPYANSIYERNFGTEHHDRRSIYDIKAEEIPTHDMLCAGFPCQPFSYAGERKGFKDETSGTLFHELLRIIRHHRPKILLLENVRGLLSNDKGATFGIILESLSELGYILEWQVLNSKHWGVPQNRPRTFIIGHLGGISRREVLPFTEVDRVSYAEARREQGQTGTWGAVASTIDGRYGALRNTGETYLAEPYLVDLPESKARKIPTTWTEPDPEMLETFTPIGIELAHTQANMREGRFSNDIKALDGSNTKGIMVPVLIHRGFIGVDGEPRIYTDDSPAITTPVGGHHLPEVLTVGYRVRKLTPVECERLQGFPDNWTQYGVEGKAISDTRRYKGLGNAVTTRVIYLLGVRLMERVFNV